MIGPYILCLHYLQGIGTSSFVYDGQGNAYATCFYVGLKTAVSIGKNPKPGQDDPGARNEVCA